MYDNDNKPQPIDFFKMDWGKDRCNRHGGWSHGTGQYPQKCPACAVENVLINMFAFSSSLVGAVSSMSEGDSNKDLMNSSAEIFAALISKQGHEFYKSEIFGDMMNSWLNDADSPISQQTHFLAKGNNTIN